ncbi:unnamed protein product [Lepeophtheirus salmonis]|uniref:(salmon louse) hypothetical protein n=1 Tax=Lepeophtheirus salmonis TaxID=72036 RepID=A0A7R8CV47_LEPSM|nr:unnamed protein product [Lepeophtheirus salmonis]CAF2942108.1 unnamed protein product [Lepeophtheirus salmonis]
MPLLEGTSSSLFQDKINLLKDRNRNTYIYPQTMSLPHFKLMDFFDTKRSGARGFHEGIFDQGFGGFSPLRKRAGRLVIDKRRPEMTSRGIHADAFTSIDPYSVSKVSSSSLNDESLKPYGVRGIFLKRNPEMDTNGFYGDTFNSGFGDFYPSKRVYPSKIRMSPGRYLVHKRFQSLKPKRLTSNTNGGFGDFYTMKRSPLISSPSLEGDDTLLDERRRINDRLIELLIERDALSEGNEDDLMSRA